MTFTARSRAGTNVEVESGKETTVFVEAPVLPLMLLCASGGSRPACPFEPRAGMNQPSADVEEDVGAQPEWPLCAMWRGWKIDDRWRAAKTALEPSSDLMLSLLARAETATRRH